MLEKILIAYYSWSGNTRSIAGKIREITGGDIIEIVPAVPYPDDYTGVVNQAKKEISEGFRPELETFTGSIDDYSRIFIGSPNWWNTVAPPVAGFLGKHDLTGKTIFPFCTHGGGGQGKIAVDIARLCPDAYVSDCMSINGSGSGAEIKSLSEWLLRNTAISKPKVQDYKR